MADHLGENPNKKYLYMIYQGDLKELVGATPPSHKHYVLECPFCLEHLNESNHKLFITLDYTKGYCQRCKSKFFNETKDSEVIDELTTPRFHYVESENYIGEVLKVDCDYYHYSKPTSELGLHYLARRNPALLEHYQKIGIRFRNNKVITPSYWNNEVIYYQVRGYNLEDEKYRSFFMPEINRKPIWVNPLNDPTNTKICICEGSYGALGAWFKFGGKVNTFASYGSELTSYQMWMISHIMFEDVYLYYDDVSINEHTKYNLRKFNSLLFRNIYSIKSVLGDPEDDYINNKELNIMKYY